MTDFLRSLLRKEQGTGLEIRPRLPSRFEPSPPSELEPDMSPFPAIEPFVQDSAQPLGEERRDKLFSESSFRQEAVQRSGETKKQSKKEPRSLAEEKASQMNMARDSSPFHAFEQSPSAREASFARRAPVGSSPLTAKEIPQKQGAHREEGPAPAAPGKLFLVEEKPTRKDSNLPHSPAAPLFATAEGIPEEKGILRKGRSKPERSVFARKVLQRQPLPEGKTPVAREKTPRSYQSKKLPPGGDFPKPRPAARTQASEKGPTIRVRIGRVEVRTQPERERPRMPHTEPYQAPISLEAYLKRRSEEP